ncbi:MAG: AraC family transcriptional regulator, partial [Myxococcales bacterium]|nr:AraC family transcriptional regulator [Myxococcales bacterium]
MKDTDEHTRDSDASPSLELTAPRAGERYAQYVEAASGLFSVNPVAPRGARDARTQLFDLGAVVAAHVAFSESAFSRTRRHVDRTGAGILVEYYRAGRHRGDVGGRTFDHGPELLTISDLARPMCSLAEARSTIGVVLPRESVGGLARLERAGGLITQAAHSAAGQALIQHMEAVVDEGAGEAAGAAITELVALVLQTAEVPGRVLDAPIRRYVGAHLADPAFGVGHIMRAFGCSRATVYRVFEPYGGVGAFIRSERLRQAFERLARAAPGDAKVWQVAAEVGFPDPFHFSRAFHQHFGVRPSTILETGT